MHGKLQNLTCDIQIVGGGILGSALAGLLAQRGYRVRVYRLGNQGRPRADTLRNQGWLQSGLIYVGKIGRTKDGKSVAEFDRKQGRILAARMYSAGLVMLEGLGIPLPANDLRGILRVHPDPESEAKLLEDAAYLGVEDIVLKLSPDEAVKRLGPLFEDGSYFTIPDSPFPESMVMHVLRQKAEEAGAKFIEARAPVVLEKDDHSPSGHVVHVDGNKESSRATIVAAGAGSSELLRALGIDPRMKFQQTPLLVVDGCHQIEAPIFADRPREFSFVRHPPNGQSLPEGALVIGTSVVEENIPFTNYDERFIREELIEQFAKSLPVCLKGHVETGRFTAGYEVVPVGVTDDLGHDLHYVEPWVEWVGKEQGMQLMLAMPGRATMGLLTAEMILSEIETEIEPVLIGANGASPKGGGWNEGIFMHFDREYTFDDRNRK